MKRKLPSLDKPYPKHREVSREERELWESLLAGKGSRKKTTRLPAPDEPLPPLPPAHRKTAASPAPVLEKATYAKLKRGAIRIDAKLDLHGHSRESAHIALVAFIQAAVLRGARTLLVITGKGRAGAPDTLRALLPRWLAESPLREHVIAYDIAGSRHGGAGAWYVRVRRGMGNRD